jgi:hypothetical protein
MRVIYEQSCKKRSDSAKLSTANQPKQATKNHGRLGNGSPFFLCYARLRRSRDEDWNKG